MSDMVNPVNPPVGPQSLLLFFIDSHVSEPQLHVSCEFHLHRGTRKVIDTASTQFIDRLKLHVFLRYRIQIPSPPFPFQNQYTSFASILVNVKPVKLANSGGLGERKFNTLAHAFSFPSPQKNAEDKDEKTKQKLLTKSSKCTK